MKYLGIDWGLKRVGLAVSEGELASPWQSLAVKNLEDGITQIKKIVTSAGFDLIVIGRPEGEMGKLVDKAVVLMKKSSLKVLVVDETLSTREAKETMLEMGYGRKARRDDNAVSASIILQRFLEDA